MKLDKLETIDQLECFLDGSQGCTYEVLCTKAERYHWIQATLVRLQYHGLSKKEKGIVIRFLITISNYSRQQLTRLIQQYIKTGKLVCKQQPKRGFSRRYTDADIVLLAELDEIHETPCGAVIKKLCERIYRQTGNSQYERLASISASHIYNLRRSNAYHRKRRHFTKTQSKKSSIGERRKPNPMKQPGYLRVDTVHQGDQDKKKGVYHVNLVDEVTQFEISFSTEKISERYLLPGLKLALSKLPFEIRGFHSDNGSEYINKNVSELLDKLNIEFTKSRSRQSNDNALAESKNASVIRKHFGYSHISQEWASELNEAIHDPLYRYQNFHRPCFFPITEIDAKGKQKKKYLYENLMTPYEKLISLDGIEKHLKEHVSLESLHCFANEMNDSEAAKILQKSKIQMFAKIFRQTA